jgi:hypothetical protein
MSHENRVRILITLAVLLCAISLTLVSRAEEAAFTPQGAQSVKDRESKPYWRLSPFSLYGFAVLLCTYG